MSRMSSEPAERSASSTITKSIGATTSPCWIACISAPWAPAAALSAANMPSVMKPSWATDE